MNTHRSGTLPAIILGIALALGLLLPGSAFAAEAEDFSTVTNRYAWSGQLTLSVDAHLYGSDFEDGKPEFISRYTPLRDFSGDDYPGYWADFSSIHLGLRDNETGRTVFGLERTSHAYFNQENELFFDPGPLRLEVGHRLYRSQKMKPDNRPDPAAPTDSIFRAFNDDSFGREDYYVQRNDFDTGITLRPSAYGHDGSQIGNLDLFYHQSDRESVRYFDYVTTARLVQGTANRNAIRWRGVNQKLIEDVNRGGLGLSFSPYQWINVYYEFSVEKYDNRLSNDSLASTPGAPRLPTDPDRFADQANRDMWQLREVSLGYIPSTLKLVNQIKFDKTIGPGKLNFGYANTFLEQDDFSLFAQNRGYDQGRIITHSAYANWSQPLTRNILWDAHVNYRLRDNHSTFPALHPTNTAPGGTNQLDFLNPLLDGDSHGGVFGPWIDGIETFRFGTEFTFLLPVASSRIVTGWEREDTSRDLVWGDPAPGVRRTIDPSESTVRPDSVNDTLFVNYSARLAKNLRLRWNNSVTLGDEVGLVSEAETGYKGRVGLTYTLPKLLQGATVDVFYQARYSQNDDFTIQAANPPVAGTVSSAQQDREQVFQSAGLTFTLLPTLKWASYTGYIWHRDSLEANFLRTSHRRYENWGFLSAEPSRYLTDAHTAFAGTSYQFTEKLSGSADYSITAIGGELGSGEIGTALGRDNELDNVTHQVGAGLAYHIRANWSVAARYAYALYDDQVNGRLNSDYHTIGTSLTMRF